MERSPRGYALAAARVAVAAALIAGGECATAQTLPRFDFWLTGAWKARHDVSLKHTAEGMLITIRGKDPFITGPAQDYPPGRPLWMFLHLKSDAGGSGQVFYYRAEASEQSSVRFPVRKGEWEEVRVPLPPLGVGYYIRFDPPGTRGTCLLASIRFELRPPEAAPAPPVPNAR